MAMMDDREKSFENKFVNDEKIKFKTEMLRNKMLGDWLAEKFSLVGEAKKQYIIDIMKSDLQEPGVGDIIKKVETDMVKYNLKISNQELVEKIEKFGNEALSNLKK